MSIPGEKLLLKLLEQLGEGIGACARPWLIKRDARATAIANAEAKRITRLAQEQIRQDVKDVRSGKKLIGKDYSLISSSNGETQIGLEASELKSRYLGALARAGERPERLIEVERQINLEQISLMAYEEAAQDADGSPDAQPFDPDWFSQWRNRAQDISNENMQRLWARVVKEEAKAAGSFSVHTMEFLSRMSRNDASLIEKIGKLALDERHIFSNDDSYLEQYGLTFDKVLYLSDLGILSGVSGLSTLTWVSKFKEQGVGRIAVIKCCERALVFHPKDATISHINIGGYAISSIGTQLLRLADCSADLRYLKDVADNVRNQCSSIKIGRTERVTDSQHSVRDMEEF